MRDNVTPFRRKPPPKPKSRFNVASHRGRAVAMQVLTLIAFALNYELTGLSNWIAWGVGVAAAAIAGSNRATAMPWAATHHEQGLRTIVIGWLVSMVANLVANMILIMRAPTAIAGPILIGVFWIQIAVLIWVAIRAGIGLILAIVRRPVWRPRSLLL